MLRELPDDLRHQDDSVGGPPPAWHSYISVSHHPFTPFFGLGDREEEVEVNPVEVINDLKYKNQEMDKRVPAVAQRYTAIDPISPFFRKDLNYYGFGQTDVGNLKVAASVLSSALSAYHGFKRNKTLGWATVWGMAGFVIPVLPLLAVYQGFGKAK